MKGPCQQDRALAFLGGSCQQAEGMYDRLRASRSFAKVGLQANPYLILAAWNRAN